MKRDVPDPPDNEKKMGLEIYLTDTDRLNGKLRRDVEDFIVEEISEPPPEDPTGQFLIARVRARNWETNRLVREFSKRLHISRKRIGFAGTKDKRAITTQLFSFKCVEPNLRSMNVKDVDVSDIFRSPRGLTLGDLKGNKFWIRISEIEFDTENSKNILNRSLSNIIKIGGFPNFFGYQRFGVIRPITHIVGRHILNRDIEKAVMAYIGSPSKEEPENTKEARIRLENEMDFNSALDYYPRTCTFERMILHHLSRRSEDFMGAIDVLPDNLKMMFVHSYQSYLFNLILSERIKRDLPLNEPILGDLVLPLNNRGLPDHSRYIPVKKSNIREMTKILKEGKGFVSGLILGTESSYSDGEMGDIERKIVETQNISQEDFNIPEMAGLSSKGMRRELMAPIFDLMWRAVTDRNSPGEKSSIDLRFSLFKGTYATSFLRELMKSEDLRDY